MKASHVLKKYEISRNTLCCWVRDGLIKYTRTPSGRYDYVIDENTVIMSKERKTILYGRVSTSAQKENLKRQVERLREFSVARGLNIGEIYTDVASALNYNRAGYNKLFGQIIDGEVENVIVEYKDRLLRIGFDDFEKICKKFRTNIIVLDDSLYDKDKTKAKEITEDLISIIHHFSMKIYSSRKRKNVIKELQKEE